MFKILIFFIVLLPLGCLAQFTISGRVLNQADTKPVANASVFISNATIGAKTADDGTFTLSRLKPGKYQLIVSMLGFDTYSQPVVIESSNIILPDITIFPKSIALKQVTIKYHADPNREKYLNWFADEFLGTSAIAKDCRILNPGIIDINYQEDTGTLTASTSGFLEIENAALGYKIKYLLADFTMTNKNDISKKVYYKGSVLYEELKGSPAQERHWQKSRQEIYDGSGMHFFRSAYNNRTDQEGFRILQLANFANPDRPSDSVIEARIKLYKTLKYKTWADSAALYTKKLRLPTMLQKLITSPLSDQEIVSLTDKPGIKALGCENDGLYITYSKDHRFHKNNMLDYLDAANNTDNTLISFNQPKAYFYSNGVLLDPYSVIFKGVWGHKRLAEQLPLDYEPATGYTRENNAVADNIVSKITDFDAAHPVEKAYLQFDKPYYAAGDTIYFKAYITTGGQHLLSDISGVLHVDLINTNDKVDQSIKLPIDSGLAWGDFALPDSLPKGNYRVRAYTRWMQNDGDLDFFDKMIPVGSLNDTRIPESLAKKPVPATANPVDIQFFPEGGTLVAGIRSKVAFKAIGANGLSINVKGVVVDNDDQVITTFASSHLGMGYFYLTPEEGKTYKTKLTYADGTQNINNLTLPVAGGITLAVNNDSGTKIAVSIQVSKDFYKATHNRNYPVVVTCGGVSTSTACMLDSQAVHFDISTKKLRTGVASVTLFSPSGEPLCERLLFIQNNDQLKLGISSDKAIYPAMSKVKLSITAHSGAAYPAAAHFSIAVVDEQKVMTDENAENSILSNLLLTSDLKGFVEQPGYYFNGADTAAPGNLDLLMLTQGYRRFQWKEILNSKSTGDMASYPAEKGLDISGHLKTKGGLPVSNTEITLLPKSGGQVQTKITDANGRFLFTNLNFGNGARFVLTIQSPSARSGIITFDNTFTKPRVMPVNASGTLYLTNAYAAALQEQETGIASNNKFKPILLKRINVISTKNTGGYRSSNLGGSGHADQVIMGDDIKNSATLSTGLNGRALGILFSQGVPYMPNSASVSLTSKNVGQETVSAMLIVVDGVELGTSDIDQISPASVESVEILKGANTSIYGIKGGGGVMVINTRQGGQSESMKPNEMSPGIFSITPTGFYKAREFYSPKYEHTELAASHHDLRSTVYWNPEIKTDKNGSASFDFYNADGTGTYRVVVEGIDSEGNLGRQVYRYKVE